MSSKRSVSHATSVLLVSGCLGGISTAALAQPAATAPITKLTTVDVQPTGAPPTGPHSVVIEHDPGLATHTIYRPSQLSMAEHPVLVWGEGGCAKNGLMFPEYLREIASHGFVVIADGPPVPRPAGGANGAGAPPGGPAGGPPPAGARAAGAGGPGADGRRAGLPSGPGMVNGTALVAALDWLEAESANPQSRFYRKVDVEDVAAMGMSCGGLMSYGAASDPRVSTVGIWNSGLLPNEADASANPKIYAGIHPSIGHGGTYNQDNGGPFGVAAVAWLEWQLLGDTSAPGRGFFVGDACGICKDSNWTTDSRSLR